MRSVEYSCLCCLSCLSEHFPLTLTDLCTGLRLFHTYNSLCAPPVCPLSPYSWSYITSQCFRKIPLQILSECVSPLTSRLTVPRLRRAARNAPFMPKIMPTLRTRLQDYPRKLLVQSIRKSGWGHA